ncbi:hypothetical protein EAX61_09390 [Dokdonia sinensis]|uniref:Uncharacterized protein n=1 Tax=Dokdonia sinensis TaxID=2479847 RepID=A0A3M0G0L9_9FLAO|nr:hypothetical protein [Dokdonia sinensis]RMB58510.1 hypothetical protein EAX61_09390 [Dokdonia sinensis]
MKRIKKLSSFAILLLLCASCVQKQHMKIVTFRIDMTAVMPLGNVGLKGQFTSPSWEQEIPLTDDDKDGVYEVTISKETAQNTAEFKFIHNGEYELENQKNRQIQMKYEPETVIYEAVFNDPNGIQTNKLK